MSSNSSPSFSSLGTICELGGVAQVDCELVAVKFTRVGVQPQGRGTKGEAMRPISGCQVAQGIRADER